MKRLLYLAAALLLSQAALAGTNEGIILAVHGNWEGVSTSSAGPTVLPTGVDGLVPTASPDPYGLEWFTLVAVSPAENNPAFDVAIFGIGDYDPEICEIVVSKPAHWGYYTIEIRSDGWPGPRSGTAIAYGEVGCLTAHIEPLYYLGIYATGPGEIPLGDHYPRQRAVVVYGMACGATNLTIEEDPFAAYGTIGCGGAQGRNIIPWSQPQTPVERTTWGAIKAMYN